MLSSKLIATTGLLGAITLAATGCSSSGGSAAKTTPAAPTTPAPTTSQTSTQPPAGPAPADAATKAAVIKAYTTFFGGTKSIPALVADLQNGDKLGDALAAQAKNPVAATLTATVSAVTLENPHVANVTFTLLSKGAALLTNTPGKAVLVDGTWRLAADTFCGLVAAAGPVPPSCADTTITALPTS
jgi:hypothetical protein